MADPSNPRTPKALLNLARTIIDFLDEYPTANMPTTIANINRERVELLHHLIRLRRESLASATRPQPLEGSTGMHQNAPQSTQPAPPSHVDSDGRQELLITRKPVPTGHEQTQQATTEAPPHIAVNHCQYSKKFFHASLTYSCNTMYHFSVIHFHVPIATISYSLFPF